MTRRGVALLPLALLAGCSIFTSDSAGQPALLTKLPRELTAQENLLIGASNQFGFDLLREARRSAPDANHFLSPLSAVMALGMTLNGANGTTLDSMRLALRLGTASLDEVNAAFRSLLDLLGNLDHSNKFAIANSIWADAGFPFLANFLNTGKTSFDAEVRSLDLQAPASLGVINDWVKQKTAGKIPSILDAIDANAVLFLINAIYFKGAWRQAFDPKDTHQAPFHNADGTVPQVPTMVLAPTQLRFAFAPDHEVIELLYGNGAFAMTIVLATPGHSLEALADGLDAARWNEWIAGLHEAEQGLTLPKFRLDYQRTLNSDLSSLGMRIAFDATRADFSRMADLSNGGNLSISEVKQKTFVDVNEEGTEAAAATSVGIVVTSAPATIEVNRPFLFAIRERLSGTIFFVGQVSKLP
jgi:serpin B